MAPPMGGVGPEPAVLVEVVVGVIELAEAIGVGYVAGLGLEVEPEAPVVLGAPRALDCHLAPFARRGRERAALPWSVDV